MQRVAAENPRILNLESDYLERQPRVIVQIDRNKAADLGVSLQTVGRTLETMLGSRIVTTFERAGEEYDVILQARTEQRASVGDLDNLYVRSDKNGDLLPLSALVRIEERAGPTELRRTDRMRAIELAGSLAPGYTLGEAVAYMEQVIREEAPEAQIIYNGETYQLKQSGDALWITFAFALLIVYLVLAAQFESFIHPIVILVTVPLALTGALLGLFLFNSTINIFSQIGCIMLIGIACKNGILIVEFANQLRDRGVEFVDAVIQSSATRLRPGAHDQPVHRLRRAAADAGARRGRRESRVDRRHRVLRHHRLARHDAVRRAGAVPADRAQHPLAGVHVAAHRQPARQARTGAWRGANGGPREPRSELTRTRPHVGRHTAVIERKRHSPI